jgi:AbiU2
MPKTVIMRLAQAISEDLYQAVAYYEVFVPSARDPALIDCVNSHQIHEGFNVISEALQLGVITTLCRIWDKRRGTARIAEIARRLRENSHLVSDQAELTQWLADVEKTEQSHELAALRGFRNVGLAHRSDPNLPDPRTKSNTRRVLHGDERCVLERTVSLVEKLDGLIGSSHRINFGQERQNWQRRASKFWGATPSQSAKL